MSFYPNYPKTQSLTGWLGAAALFCTQVMSGKVYLSPLCLSKFNRFPGPLKQNPLFSKIFWGFKFKAGFEIETCDFFKPENFYSQNFQQLLLNTDYSAEAHAGFKLPKSWLRQPFKMSPRLLSLDIHNNLQAQFFELFDWETWFSRPLVVGVEGGYNKLLFNFYSYANPDNWMWAPESARVLWKFTIGGWNSFWGLSTFAGKKLAQHIQTDANGQVVKSESEKKVHKLHYEFHTSVSFGFFSRVLKGQICTRVLLNTTAFASQSWHWLVSEGRQCAFAFECKFINRSQEKLESFLENEFSTALRTMDYCFYDSSLKLEGFKPQAEESLLQTASDETQEVQLDEESKQEQSSNPLKTAPFISGSRDSLALATHESEDLQLYPDGSVIFPTMDSPQVSNKIEQAARYFSESIERNIHDSPNENYRAEPFKFNIRTHDGSQVHCQGLLENAILEGRRPIELTACQSRYEKGDTRLEVRLHSAECYDDISRTYAQRAAFQMGAQLDSDKAVIAYGAMDVVRSRKEMSIGFQMTVQTPEKVPSYFFHNALEAPRVSHETLTTVSKRHMIRQ